MAGLGFFLGMAFLSHIFNPAAAAGRNATDACIRSLHRISRDTGISESGTLRHAAYFSRPANRRSIMAAMKAGGQEKERRKIQALMTVLPMSVDLLDAAAEVYCLESNGRISAKQRLIFREQAEAIGRDDKNALNLLKKLKAQGDRLTGTVRKPRLLSP